MLSAIFHGVLYAIFVPVGVNVLLLSATWREILIEKLLVKRKKIKSLIVGYQIYLLRLVSPVKKKFKRISHSDNPQVHCRVCGWGYAMSWTFLGSPFPHPHPQSVFKMMDYVVCVFKFFLQTNLLLMWIFT